MRILKELIIARLIKTIKRRRHRTPLIDVDEAWQEFQTYYNIPEGEGRSLYPTGEETKRGST